MSLASHGSSRKSVASHVAITRWQSHDGNHAWQCKLESMVSKRRQPATVCMAIDGTDLVTKTPALSPVGSRKGTCVFLRPEPSIMRPVCSRYRSLVYLQPGKSMAGAAQ